jgi:hypothetical protein
MFAFLYEIIQKIIFQLIYFHVNFVSIKPHMILCLIEQIYFKF